MRKTILSLVVCLGLCWSGQGYAQTLQLEKGDHISIIGNTTADRMQHHAWLETFIHATHPELNLTFRNLAFPGDELKVRPREDNFGSPDQWLAKNQTDVVFAFFGYNEALKGPQAVDGFKKDLAEVIDGMLAQKYNGKSAPKIVMFSPIAHENLYSRHLPDGSKNNPNLKLYTEAMGEVCQAKDVLFVDLFTPSQKLYADAEKPLTMNGIHLLDHGNRAIAEVIAGQLFGKPVPDAGLDAIAKLRDAVLEKNYYWFSRYRVVDGYNVFGGRSKLAWFGQSNADVMLREMEIFDVMTANRDQRVWAVAQGGDLEVKDDNIPEELVVKSNRDGDMADGSFSYRTAEEGLKKLEMHKDLQANVFASEEMFPELINPVQMAVDPNGHLYASVWPSYPHWNPTEPRLDRIVCLPDEDGDGVADRCVIFADQLNSVTGFEFWGGGMIVAALPELWFLKDTDGDLKADVKIRILQGLSSADSHHSANAMLLGPDGWIYWSRGIFNVATMETPTKTYRSTQTGVHRFNPRTFEMEFHFPIGPNPHGDVFDQWGYQFANDGTSGTGSYVDIGKGIGNKQWFDKRVRPVAATGLLASSHFPEEMQGNFLICNCIGFLGVLNHKIQYNGSDIRATEVDPILVSSDPNFRPSDVEIGSDGALYVADWANALIGHMQHNMRDPNRDHQHGRIFRVTAKNRPLIQPVRLKDKPLAEVLAAFYAKENATRYRARIELSGRDSEEVQTAIQQFVADKDVNNPDDAQAMLECLWGLEEHRMPNIDLVKTVFQASEPRVRAAAIRTLGHWSDSIDGWEPTLVAAASDASPLVRAEAIKSAVEFTGPTAAEVVFQAASKEMDPELTRLLQYAQSRIDVDTMIAEAIRSGRKLSPAATSYALEKASSDLLLKLDRTDEVYTAILSRGGIAPKYREEAISVLATKNNRSPLGELIAWISTAENKNLPSLNDLAGMLPQAKQAELSKSQDLLEKLASTTNSSVVRRAVYTSWIQSGGAEAAWAHASQAPAQMADLLQSVRSISKSTEAAPLYAKIRPLMFELPATLRPESGSTASDGPAVAFDYYEPNPAKNVAIETLNATKPKFSGRMANFDKYVPKGRKDAFATKQTASIVAPVAGDYKFYIASDDGSRVYVNGNLLIDNDGLHGMVEKGGNVNLTAGTHEIVVTYFDNGGGDGLRVSWEGPGIKKQAIPTSALRAAGQADLRLAAIRAITSWPGHQDEKIADFAKLSQSDGLSSAGVNALTSVPPGAVIEKLSPEDQAKVLATLLIQASEATPVQRQSKQYAKVLDLGEALVAKSTAKNSGSLNRKLVDLRNSIPVTADPKVMAMGKEIFLRESHCATCHQPHGQGMPNLYPPIDGTLWTNGSEDRLISMVLDGMHGTIEVKGKTYSSPPLPPMTGFRQLLNDEEVAAVLTYVRNSWSNRAKPITASQVAKIRAIDRGDATFWHVNDLMAKFPLEDGRKPIESTGDGWVPKFVKQWKYEDLDPKKVSASKRNFVVGQVYFNRLGCAQCHQINEKGGNFGPDLTRLGTDKATAEHILESIADPAKKIDEKYQMQTILTIDGKVVSGMTIADRPDRLVLLTDPEQPDKPVTVMKEDIEEQSNTASTIMPGGMLNWLTEEEIYDLAAFVLAGGDEKHKLFQDK
ncbi:Cytochrome c-552 precursor [Bremerella volcania]|uniref:Cytochrome c-552 n=1 Tax=Bremerella volcania TaxID=2527984 RepID=A0A518CC00_9BACT|nr:c-type cytochrome [Bremerella volcania]QDU76752.1 Cytochrome c-552 precursor [Bremerella volcania]